MDTPTIIALVLAVLALGLGVWSLIRKPTVSVMDLEEFSKMPAEIKDIWKKNMTRKLAPHILTAVDGMWMSIPAAERAKVAKSAEYATDEVIMYLNKKAARVKRDIAAMAEEFVEMVENEKKRNSAVVVMTSAPPVKQVVTALAKTAKPTAKPTVKPTKRAAE